MLVGRAARLVGDRRYRRADVLALTRPVAVREALYVRVSGAGDQLTLLTAQKQELHDAATGEVVAVYRDAGSGLSERRRGLQRLLRAAREGQFEVVRSTHEDRLARFGRLCGRWSAAARECLLKRAQQEAGRS